MTLQQFCLRWNNHQPNFISVFTNLLNNEALVDVTLAAEGQHLQAHRVVLSACSSYFQTLFTVNPCQHPIVILKDVKFSDLKTMVDFMYYGEVNVSQEQLPAILKTAEMLKIKGLTEMPEKHIGTGAFHLSKSSSLSFDKTDVMTTSVDSTGAADVRRSPSPTSPVTSRRKRLRKSSTGSGSGSTERTSEETFSEITIVPCDVKPEPLEAAVASPLKNTVRDASTDSDQQGGSQESINEDAASLLGSQDSVTGSVDMPVSIADTGPGHSSSQQSTIDLQAVKSVKQRRLLMRQPRVKKETDPLHLSPDREPRSPSSHQTPLSVAVPPVRIETQSSESQPSPPLARITSHNLLSVPQPSYLVKQHSHPLLPSQKSSQASVMVQRQLSTPTPSTSSYNPPPLQVHFVASVQPNELSSRVASPPTEMPLIRFPADTSEAYKNSSPRHRGEELRRASSSPQVGTPRESFEPRSVHCPMLRPGPALGCNFCWNTIDTHGRILRRKTKYHCPECQTNLCIVPCFQEYHERSGPGNSKDRTGNVSPTVLKPLLPKTSSI